MKRFIPALALLSAGGLLAVMSCRANSDHASKGHEGAESEEREESEEAEEHEGEEHEGLNLQKPATSLSAAIATAQKSVPDGHFLKGEIESEDGKTICSIVLATAGGDREVNIDAASGKVLATEDEKLAPEGKKLLDELAKNPHATSISAVQAVDAAVAKVPGSWALAASLSGESGKLAYAVFLIDGKDIKVASVSAADGKVQSVAKAQFEEEEEEGEEVKKP
jgi:uncharacterized membrane protein YkoI